LTIRKPVERFDATDRFSFQPMRTQEASLMSDQGRAAPRTLRRAVGTGVICLGLLFVFAGCTSSSRPNPFSDSGRLDMYNLRVENRNLYEVSVYVVPRGRRVLVGTLAPGRYDFLQFEYPKGLPLSVELENEIGDRYRIPGSVFPGGGRVDLVVSSNIRRSGFVRRR
jgi:hypothetical protein